MKKHNLYFLLTVLLAGLFASCSQEDMDGPQTNEPTSVTLSANVDGGIHTRADGKVTIPYFAFKLRYILEVWTTGANPELIYREEKTNSTGEGEDFTFTLVDNGDYKALLWADFVKGSGETTVTYSGGSYTHYEDQYYTTTPDLKTVTISRLALDGENTSFGTITPRTSLDAFYACHTISKKDGAYAEPVVLTRPFGQINISEKDADALANVYRVKFAYNVPAGFNVESGEPTQTTVQTKTIQELNAQLGTGDFTANLYYDYVFTPATGQTTLGEMTVTFPQRPESNIVIADYKIPANMPVVRNKRTNISGHIVSVSDKPSNDAKLSVTVSDGWSTDLIEEDVEVALAKKVLDNAKTSGSGDNAEDYHYTIATAEQLTALATLAKAGTVITGSTNAKYSHANYVLNADIDLENKPWTPIVSFEGTFDGQGNAIRNMNVSIQSTSAIVGGLFEVLFGTVSNLIVEGAVTVNGAGTCRAGGICGWKSSGAIKFCRFNGTVSSTTSNNESWNYAGGITGDYSGSPTITGCIADATATISGGKADDSAAGGLAGYIEGTNCEYSAWNSGETSNMIGKNANAEGGTGSGNNSFTSISELNGLLDGINNGVSESTYIWEAGSGGTVYPKLVKRTPAGN